MLNPSPHLTIELHGDISSTLPNLCSALRQMRYVFFEKEEKFLNDAYLFSQETP